MHPIIANFLDFCLILCLFWLKYVRSRVALDQNFAEKLEEDSQANYLKYGAAIGGLSLMFYGVVRMIRLRKSSTDEYEQLTQDVNDV